MPVDVFQAPRDQILAIYRDDYWNAVEGDQLPKGVDYAVFDCGVLNGVATAAKILQARLGAAVGAVVLAAKEYREYGGLGAFGIRGVEGADDRPMLSATSSYEFEGGRVYNLEASNVIKNGAGSSGAHCDIAHPEVAHAFWEAALVGSPPAAKKVEKGGLLGMPETTSNSMCTELHTGPCLSVPDALIRAKKSAAAKHAAGEGDARRGTKPRKAVAEKAVRGRAHVRRCRKSVRVASFDRTNHDCEVLTLKVLYSA